MVKIATAALFALLCGLAGAATIIESDGTSMEGWLSQWHATTSEDMTVPVWQTDGDRITGTAFYSPLHGLDLGGAMINTNAFSMEVGDVATFSMEFRGRGVVTPDRQHHLWFNYGFRTGGKDPWDTGDTAVRVSIRTGAGINIPNGFVAWNLVSDSWTPPYPSCDISSDENYESDPVTVTFSVQRIPSGFGPSTLTTSNHMTGVEKTAISRAGQLNQNHSSASNLYVYFMLPPEFDDSGGFSTAGSTVTLSNMKLTIEKSSAPYAAVLEEEALVMPKHIIENILDVKRLSNVEAGRQYQAQVSGQVLNLHPDHSRIFIHDGDAGIYVELDGPAGDIEGLKIGSEVQVIGETHSGGYSPVLFAPGVDITGWRPLPRARKLDRTLLHSTSIDVEWVEVEGRPVAMEYVESFDHFLISMEVHDTIMDVFVPHSEDAYEKMKPFMFQRVRISGVIGTTANNRLQMTGRVLYINNVDDFFLMHSPSGAMPTDLPIDQIMQYWKNSQGLVKTRGTVVGVTPNELYLRGEQGNLKASIFNEGPLEVGDVVDVTGYVILQPVSPALQTIEVARVDTGSAPEPKIILLEGGGVNPGWNYELVQLDAEFVHAERTFTRQPSRADEGTHSEFTRETLWCRVGTRVFEARLPAGVSPSESLRPGSTLQLIGICHVLKTKNPRLDQMADSFWLELPNADSITVIKQVSWWTPRRLVLGLMTALTCSLLFLFWVLSLRKTVTRQTNTIGAQIERETTLNERQRIARELHDTLEQGLTALSLQLRRIYRKVQQAMPEGLPIIEKAETTLRVCREESRASIQDLRGSSLEAMDLPSAIQATFDQQIDDTSLDLKAIDIKLDVEGTLIRLTLFAKQQLLRLVVEALHNAIQHASPTKIQITLTYSGEELQVVVEDNGSGFDPELITDSGRFGVLGMYERANRLNSTLNIESTKGVGTRVILVCPIKSFVEEKKL